jgi:hypothetical protein
MKLCLNSFIDEKYTNPVGVYTLSSRSSKKKVFNQLETIKERIPLKKSFFYQSKPVLPKISNEKTPEIIKFEKASKKLSGLFDKLYNNSKISSMSLSRSEMLVNLDFNNKSIKKLTFKNFSEENHFDSSKSNQFLSFSRNSNSKIVKNAQNTQIIKTLGCKTTLKPIFKKVFVCENPSWISPGQFSLLNSSISIPKSSILPRNKKSNNLLHNLL